MKHSLIESINKAYKLLESDEPEFIEEEPVEEEPLEELEYVEEEPIEEIEVEEEFPEEVEEKVNDLEARVEVIENELGITPEEDIDTEEEVEEKSIEEKFNDRIHKDFIFFSGLPEDVEITEELLEKRNCKQAYIPSVARRNKITSDEVRNSLLGR